MNHIKIDLILAYIIYFLSQGKGEKLLIIFIE